jgi:hypothetical protein
MAKLKSGTRVYGNLLVDTGVDLSSVTLTTAVAGMVEYDGTAFYGSPAASTRGVIPTEHLIVLNATNTLTSQTGVQPLFDGGGGPAGGALTLPVGTYKFECFYALTSMSTGSNGSFGFALGGGATKTEGWYASATKSAFTTANTLQGTWNTAANTSLTSSNTTSTGYAFINGHFRITATGTIIPQVSLGVSAAAVVQTNSFFRCSPVGSATAVSVGNWA